MSSLTSRSTRYVESVKLVDVHSTSRLSLRPMPNAPRQALRAMAVSLAHATPTQQCTMPAVINPTCVSQRAVSRGWWGIGRGYRAWRGR